MVQRVLCFPGYGQNAAVLDIKLSALKQYCANDVQFVCIDPLYVLHPRGAADGASASEEYAETPYDAASEERRAWGFPTDEEHTYFDGLEPAVASIRDFLAKQSKPFDGVIGFSQGAAIASLTACLLEDPSRYPEFLVNGQPPQPPMRFAICISGAKPLDMPFTKFYEGSPKLKTPVLHVVGRTDVVVSWKRTKMFIDAYENSRVEWHEGGHYIPSTLSWRAFFKTYITSFDPKAATGELRSPSLPNDIPWTYWLANTKGMVMAN